jgi:ankyrin repeat protein
LDAKTKLWNACKLGDNELLSSIVDKLMTKAKECEEQNKEDEIAGSMSSPSNTALVNVEDVARLFNDINEDGNTLLHLAAIGGYHDQVW